MKKVILVIIILCLIPTIAIADSGMPEFYDLDDKLSFSVTSSQTEIEIGEEIQLTIELRNNTYNPIYLRRTNGWISRDYGGISMDLSDYVVEPGENLILDLTYEVHDKMNFYKKDDKFYFDIDLFLAYEATMDFTYKDKFFKDGYIDFAKKQEEPIPIKVTNLKDGNDLIEFELLTSRDIFGVSSTYYYNNLDRLYVCYLDNEITLKNKSGKSLERLNLYSSDRGSEEYIELEDGDALKMYHSSEYYFENYNEIPQEIQNKYQGTFVMNGDFYFFEKVYDCKVANKNEPKVEKRLVKKPSEKDGYIDYTLFLKNKSGRTIHNFYVVSGYDNLDTFDEKNCYRDFEHNEIIEKSIIIEEDLPFEAYWGRGINSYISYFGEYIKGGESGFDDDGYSIYTPKIDNLEWYRDIYVIENELENTPEPEQKPIASPMPTTSFPPYEHVEIQQVERKNSLPIWVYIVIPIVVLISLGLVIYLKKRRIK